MGFLLGFIAAVLLIFFVVRALLSILGNDEQAFIMNVIAIILVIIGAIYLALH